MEKLKMKDYKDLALQGQVLIDYLKVMVARHDWHGVSDAANDLRELEAEMRSLEWKPNRDVE
jgi:hypothetical protein